MKILPLLLGVGLASSAAAETTRFAVVVGNDAGNDARPRLRFAEEDAAKFARVMVELGGVPSDNLYLLQGRSRDALADTFDRVGQRIAASHQAPGQRVMLIFYFSGHSDGDGIELGPNALSFSDLRRRLLGTGAEVRVAIVDACRSGSLLAAKGGRLRETFEIRLADDPKTSGTVLLTSSAADEDALESPEIKGSFFTHHLVSGLRGAADASGDGRVTLSEAYRYAYDHTLAATSQTLAGAQHPAYDIQLSGMGELVLTQPAKPSAALVLPAGFERAFVSEPSRDAVLAEVPAGAPRIVAVPPGDYLIRLWRSNTVYAGRVAVARGVSQPIAWNDLVPAQVSSNESEKGGPLDVADADLAEAIQLYRRALEPEKSSAALRRLLEHEPPVVVASNAHLYLGLIALDAIQPDVAQAEFQQALRLNPTLELPMGLSPKVRVAFGIARKQLEADVRADAPAVASQTGSSSTTSQAAAPTEAIAIAPPAEPGHSHVLSLSLAGAGAVAAAFAVYGGVQVLGYQSDISQMQKGIGVPAQQVKSDYSNAQTWQAAWLILAGCAAAAGVASGFTW